VFFASSLLFCFRWRLAVYDVWRRTHRTDQRRRRQTLAHLSYYYSSPAERLTSSWASSSVFTFYTSRSVPSECYGRSFGLCRLLKRFFRLRVRSPVFVCVYVYPSADWLFFFFYLSSSLLLFLSETTTKKKSKVCVHARVFVVCCSESLHVCLHPLAAFGVVIVSRWRHTLPRATGPLCCFAVVAIVYVYGSSRSSFVVRHVCVCVVVR